MNDVKKILKYNLRCHFNIRKYLYGHFIKH